MKIDTIQPDAFSATMLDALMDQMTQGIIIMNVQSDKVQINPEAWALVVQGRSRTRDTFINCDMFYQICEANGQFLQHMNARDAKSYCSAILKDRLTPGAQAPVMVERVLGSTLCRIQTIVRPGVGLMWVLTDISNAKAAHEPDQDPIAGSALMKRSLEKIKVPMNGVMGMAGLLQRTDLSERQTVYADGILNAGSALSSLVSTIADYSALEFGRVSLNPMAFDLKDTVANVAKQHRQTALDKTISISLSPPQGPCDSVVGDASRIARILSILVGNAIAHTEFGGVTIAQNSKRGGTGQNPTSVISISVSDTGIGLRPAALRTMSAQLNSDRLAHSDGAQGIGMKLAVVACLVRLMNGRIRIQSEHLYGTRITVEIELPVAT